VAPLVTLLNGTESVLGDPLTMTVSGQPKQLCPPMGDSVMVYNNDLLNVAYVGYQPNIGVFNSTPVQPLTYVVMSGRRQLWGFCPAPGTAELTITPGGSYASPSPAQIAEQILLSGISLIANPQPLFSITSPVALPTSGVAQYITPVNPVTMGNGQPGMYAGNFLGYEFSLVVTCAAGEVAGTFALIQVDFFENQSDTTPIDSIRWYVSAAAAGKTSFGKGPVRGQYVQISMFNGTTSALAQSLTSMRFNGSGRTYLKDDWRDVNNGNVTVGGFKQTFGDMQRNQVFADTNLANGGGTVLNRLGNLWAGRTKLFLNVLGLTTKQCLFQLQDAAGLGGQVERVFLGDAATQIYEAEYILDRTPYLMTFTNSSGVQANITYTLIAQDY
jgi:hypothetical protein